MQLIRFDLRIESAFATPPKGDTLFGQLCWLILQRYGENRLKALLEGYTDNQPFMIVSDFLAKNHIQLPPIPRWMIDPASYDIAQRKQIKNRVMVDIDTFRDNGFRLDAPTLMTAKDKHDFLPEGEIQMRVKINRLSGTTGTGFDPFANIRYDYHENTNAAFYLLFDTERIALSDIVATIESMAMTGFGKDATIGRGRFRILSYDSLRWEAHEANAMITLSPSVLGEQGFEEVYYEPFTRWGKHGGYLANSDRVWKNPVLMADTFACIVSNPKPFVGHGVGGISEAIRESVHQGYAITLPAVFKPKVTA